MTTNEQPQEQQPEPDADEAENLRDVPGVIGSLAVRELGDLAGKLEQLGRSAHNAFGDRIVRLAERLADIAYEARRRLAEDRLPDDAGTAEQQERRREAAGEAAIPDAGDFTFGSDG
jgi:hypothetical protein